jgi:DNA-binding transcriptional LysR family regulator
MPIRLPLCSRRMTVELRHLRCFLAIVDEGNITRAAQLLHVSQPALSRTLSQLEHSLAIRLVDRSTHHLVLTDAGKTFAVTARDAVRRVDEAISSISAAVPPIRFGHNWSSATHAAAIMRWWAAEFPHRQLRSQRNNERLAGLADGHVDVALVRGLITDRSFRCIVIDNETRMAVVPSGHRLAGAAQVSLADLSGETLIVSSTTGTTTLDLWPEPPRPTIGADLPTIDDWLIAIATSGGIGITPASTATLHPHPDVRFIPIIDAPTVPLVLVWPRRNPHPHTKAFVANAAHALSRAGVAACD